MASETKHYNKQTIESGSPLRAHSLNQRITRVALNGQNRLESNRKQSRSQDRITREDEYYEGLIQNQLNRCLTHVANGVATLEDVAYANSVLPDFETVEFVRPGYITSIIEFEPVLETRTKMLREDFVASIPHVPQED